MKRYQIITYSYDIGTDEHMDFDRLSEAIEEAKRYQKTEEYGAVYDFKTKTAYVVFGYPATNVFSDFVDVVEF